MTCLSFPFACYDLGRRLAVRPSTILLSGKDLFCWPRIKVQETPFNNLDQYFIYSITQPLIITSAGTNFFTDYYDRSLDWLTALLALEHVPLYPAPRRILLPVDGEPALLLRWAQPFLLNRPSIFTRANPYVSIYFLTSPVGIIRVEV